MRKFVAGFLVACALILCGCSKSTKWEYGTLQAAEEWSWSAGGQRYAGADSKALRAELEKAGIAKPGNSPSVLDAVGEQGWELISTTTQLDDGKKFIVWQFKRPKA